MKTFKITKLSIFKHFFTQNFTISGCAITVFSDLLQLKTTHGKPVFVGELNYGSDLFYIEKVPLRDQIFGKQMNRVYAFQGNCINASATFQFLYVNHSLVYLSTVVAISLLLGIMFLVNGYLLSFLFFIGYYLFSDFLFHLILFLNGKEYQLDLEQFIQQVKQEQ